MNKEDMDINDIIAEAMNKKAAAEKKPTSDIGAEAENVSAGNTDGAKTAKSAGDYRSDMVFRYADDDEGREHSGGSGGSKRNKGGQNSKSSKGGKGAKKSKNGKKKSSVKKAVIITLLVILLLLIIAVVGAYIFIMSKIDKINTVDREYDNSVYESIEEAPPEEENPNSEPDSPDSEVEELDSKIDEIIKDETIPIKFSDDVFNILLIGTDARTSDYRGRSDSMILVSINKKTGQIVMTSIMRDIYLSIPGKSKNRINAAYSWGGASLLIKTIEDHFKIRIDKYVQVDFLSFEKVINAVGGVDMYINDDEMSIMKPLLGDQYHGAGTYHLDGAQALRFARIRYVGKSDFERTQRQRRMLQEILRSAQSLSISEMNDWLDVILPMLTTDLERGEILDLILHSGSYLKYDRVELRIPYDGTWRNMRIGGKAVLGIDFEKNRKKMIEVIYGE